MYICYPELFTEKVTLGHTPDEAFYKYRRYWDGAAEVEDLFFFEVAVIRKVEFSIKLIETKSENVH